MVISQLLVNFIPDHATKHQHFIVSNFRKTFHLFLEYGELPALPILQITFNPSYESAFTELLNARDSQRLSSHSWIRPHYVRFDVTRHTYQHLNVWPLGDIHVRRQGFVVMFDTLAPVCQIVSLQETTSGFKGEVQ